MTKVKCEQIQPSLLDYGEGRLSGPEAAGVREHLAECAECAALMRVEATFARQLATILEEKPANDVWAVIRAKTKPRRIQPVFWARSVLSNGARRMTAAAAAAALIVVALTSVLTTQNAPDKTPDWPKNAVTVKWSDDPLGNNTDAVIDFIDSM